MLRSKNSAIYDNFQWFVINFASFALVIFFLHFIDFWQPSNFQPLSVTGLLAGTTAIYLKGKLYNDLLYSGFKDGNYQDVNSNLQ